MGREDDANGRRWLKEVLAPVRPAFRELLFVSFFVNLLALAVPVFVLQVYDRVVFFHGVSTLQALVAGVCLALLFDLILRQARSRLLQRVALRVDVELGRRLFDKLVALPLRDLEGRPAAFWQALFRDVETVRNTYSGASAVLVADLPFALLFAGFVLLIAAPIAWLFLIIVPAFVLLAWVSGRAMSRAGEAERDAGYERDRLIGEMCAGRTTVKALGLDTALRPRWEERHARTVESAVHRGARADTFLNMGLTLTMLTTVALTTFGAMAIIDQQLSIGALIATNMVASRIIAPFQQLVIQWRGFIASRQAVRRLGTILAREGEKAEGSVAQERPAGRMTLEGASFAYDGGPDARPVLRQINLNVSAPGLHAVVGPNGSGKTTLLKLMRGLYQPVEGRVLIDGADMRQFGRAELARWIGYVPQELFLFSGTVRDNIAAAAPGVADEAVVEAARRAGLHDHVVDLAEGYGTEIGEAGQRLSGGMRQRLALARALVADPAVLLLDEPSASLDREAEEALRDLLVQLGRERNILIVTHSPVLLPACDDVLALDAGRIAMAGPAREVLPRLFAPRRPRPVAEPGDAPAAVQQG